MNNKTFYYARVSTKEQNEGRQLKAFYDMGADDRDIIIDKESGKDLNRKGYNALKETMLRSGDTLVIVSLDRLSRNKQDIKNELQYFKDNNIRLKVLDLPTTLMEVPEGNEWVFDMVNNILIEVLGTIAEQERKTIKKRQRQGIDNALENGVKFGRPQAVKPDNWEEVINDLQEGKITATKAMEILNLKRTTFYKLFKVEKQEHKAKYEIVESAAGK